MFMNSLYDQNININAATFSQLLHLELKEGKFKLVRQKLQQVNISIPEYNRLWAILERNEYNYEASKKYCQKWGPTNYSLLFQAELALQTGEYQFSKDIYESLLKYDEFYINNIFHLVLLSILNHDFETSDAYLKKLEKKSLNSRDWITYVVLKKYVSYYGYNKKKKETNLEYNCYTIQRLYNSNNMDLYEHIKKHKNPLERFSKGCFFKDLDLNRLIQKVQKKIKKANALHLCTGDVYYLHLESPIGFKGDTITNDICVVTIVNTQTILTMYPVLLSESFNKEGLLTSNELRRKRYRALKN